MTLINLLEVEAQNLHSRINHNYWQSPYEDLPLSPSKFLKLLVETDIFRIFYAGVAKLVDVPDLGSGAVRHGGSSPSARTSIKRETKGERESTWVFLFFLSVFHININFQY